MGANTLLLPGCALEDCGLPLRGELGAIPGGGTRSGEVWVLVGCLGLVIFPCIFCLCFIILWNLSDPRFHCNRFETMRDCRRKYLPVSSELRRGGIENWGAVGGRAGPQDWAGGRGALAALAWRCKGSSLRVWRLEVVLLDRFFWGLVHSHPTKRTHRRLSPWSPWASPGLPSSHRCSPAAASASVKSLQLISSPPYLQVSASIAFCSYQPAKRQSNAVPLRCPAWPNFSSLVFLIKKEERKTSPSTAAGVGSWSAFVKGCANSEL